MRASRRGFKSGGFNGRANSVAERTQYEPEEVNSYEIGVRSTISGQLRLNVTAFYNDYKNFQARVSGTGLDPVTNLPSPVLSVINAGRLDIKGFEVEAAWTPLPGLLLDTQIGYLHAAYDEFADARFPGGSRAFQRPAFAPRWTWRLGAQYESNLGEHGFLTWGAQMRYRSTTALAVDNTYINGAVGTTTPVEGLLPDGLLYLRRAAGLRDRQPPLHDRRLCQQSVRRDLQDRRPGFLHDRQHPHRLLRRAADSLRPCRGSVLKRKW